MTYPDNPNGEVLTYTYDSGGIVNGVSGADPAGKTAYAQRINYDSSGAQAALTDRQRHRHHLRL